MIFLFTFFIYFLFFLFLFPFLLSSRTIIAYVVWSSLAALCITFFQWLIRRQTYKNT